MSRDINKTGFSDSTLLKLEIFGECFKAWLPVFIYDRSTPEVFIYDFFAGSGTDNDNNYGSPLVLFNIAKGKDFSYCKNVSKPIRFVFNEKIKSKAETLKKRMDDMLSKCMHTNNCEMCSYTIDVRNEEFQSLFNSPEVSSILSDNKFGKFLLLDQNGFKETSEEIFQKLLTFHKTDFIFFISSSYVKRFKDHPYTKAYIDTSRIQFEETYPKNCHKIIADYYRSLIPNNQEFYLHHFTIKKESGNYYGLIFGTAHSFGMEKFLSVCWKKDTQSGESNCNIYDDWRSDETLFYNHIEPKKIVIMKKKIRNKILSGQIVDNISGFKFTMSVGCEQKTCTHVVKKLEKEGLISRQGQLTYSSNSIHKVFRYTIKVL